VSLTDQQTTAEPEIRREVSRRRSFAIISHPDAGKTTLTEKLLLYGGAIGLAGSVRARHNQRSATSDWMELERQRGISINSTVLQFPYNGYQINLLDTPGHQDFSEDTYRTLTAVDSAVMVIDAAKGIEAQTRKLFQVCRQRGIPILTFINKMDRPAREPLALLDEIESVLGIAAVPVNWPLGDGASFRGVYDRPARQIHLFDRVERGRRIAPVQVTEVADPALRVLLGEDRHRELLSDIELLEGAGAGFDEVRVRRGEQTPVFFGSALTNFGVQLFLDAFVDLAPPPRPRQAQGQVIDPGRGDFSGFIFKIQANMDPLHRDSVAFLRVCSGRFSRDMVVQHPRTGRKLRLSHSHRLFARERELVDEAFAGDVIGLVNPGQFAIGDTLCTGPQVEFHSIPRFSPEHFAGLRNTDAAKHKQFHKGLLQLQEEGAIQILQAPHAARREPILAAVGRLQFDVVQFRLEAEYGVTTQLDPLPYQVARWLDGAPRDVAALPWGRGALLAEDRDGRSVGLFESEWHVRYWREHYPAVKYRDSADRPSAALGGGES
jgi:peptide chain release factor 3